MTNTFKDKFLSAEDAVNTIELVPPKGTDLKPLLEKAGKLREYASAINIPSNPMSALKAGALGVCCVLKQQGFEPIMHLTCKDKNRLAVQSEAIAADMLGVKNILALTGDPPQIGEQPEAKEVNDFNSYDLIKSIASMNKGKDIMGNELKGKTGIFIGAALSPEQIKDNPDFVKAKLKSGADFFQTQPVYDIDFCKQFLAEAGSDSKKILIGVLPLKSAKTAHYFNDKVPGITVPKDLISRIESAANPQKEGIALAKEFISELKGKCAGIHLMPVGNEEAVPELLGK